MGDIQTVGGQCVPEECEVNRPRIFIPTTIPVLPVLPRVVRKPAERPSFFPESVNLTVMDRPSFFPESVNLTVMDRPSFFPESVKLTVMDRPSFFPESVNLRVL